MKHKNILLAIKNQAFNEVLARYQAEIIAKSYERLTAKNHAHKKAKQWTYKAIAQSL